jgi:hypothetical protein
VVLAWMDNDAARLIDLLAAMLARREQWRPIADLDDPQVGHWRGPGRDAGRGTGAGRIRLLGPAWQAPWMPLARFAAAQLGDGVLMDWTAPLAAEVDELPRWRALAASC